MKTVLIANPKGGAGKTTLSTNLAGYLAARGETSRRFSGAHRSAGADAFARYAKLCDRGLRRQIHLRYGAFDRGPGCRPVAADRAVAAQLAASRPRAAG